MILLAFLAALAAIGFGAWLRERVARDTERVARLEREIKALREEIRKISAPVQAASAASFPADASLGAASGISSKGEEGVEQSAPAASSPAEAWQGAASVISSKGESGAEQGAPPIAFPIPPVAFAPPQIPPSRKITDAFAPAEPPGAAASIREGAEIPPVPPPPVAPPAAARAGRVDWESFVGVKLFSWVAG
ncbi:MAG TPA: hypothetical protein VKS23_05410, partial [Thermoanaerobaculia bacterium]|nr:hypothetical protein [Thermoanaerobaculia bacterium]